LPTAAASIVKFVSLTLAVNVEPSVAPSSGVVNSTRDFEASGGFVSAVGASDAAPVSLLRSSLPQPASASAATAAAQSSRRLPISMFVLRRATEAY
jgi:hypothetical protein